MLDIHFGSLPLFSGLDRLDPAKKLPDFACEEHGQETVLFRQGETRDALFIVTRGCARILLNQSKGVKPERAIHEKTTPCALPHLAIVLIAVLVTFPGWYHLGLLR